MQMHHSEFPWKGRGHIPFSQQIELFHTCFFFFSFSEVNFLIVNEAFDGTVIWKHTQTRVETPLILCCLSCLYSPWMQSHAGTELEHFWAAEYQSGTEWQLFDGTKSQPAMCCRGLSHNRSDSLYALSLFDLRLSPWSAAHWKEKLFLLVD